MNCFLINLDKNRERLAYMDKQLGLFGINYERVSGVYGKSLTSNDLRNVFSCLRSYCVEGRKMSRGEIGCALSHCKIYRCMVDRNIDCALILEDDVELQKGFSKSLMTVTRAMDFSRPQVFLLSAHGRTVASHENGWIERVKTAWCADAYCLNNKAAKIILRANYPVVCVADRWQRWASRYGLELYQVWPATAKQIQGEYASDVTLNKAMLPHGFKYAIHMIARAAEITVDKLLYEILGK